jgi:DNA-binding IclR family transcriptional regulator
MNDIKPALRVLKILELFGAVGEPLRLKDIAERLGLATSSTISLLRSLTEAGYVSFDRASWKYFPTNRIPDLGSRLSSVLVEETDLMEVMHSLQRSTKELIVVGTPNDIYIDYIRSLRSTQEIQLYSPPGTRYLMIQSGMGLLLLSRMEKAVVSRIYRRTIAERQINTKIFSEEELFDRVEKMRGQDFVFTRASEYIKATGHAGGAMISSIVPTPPNNRALVIGVGGPAERLERNNKDIIIQMRAELGRLADLVVSGAPASANVDISSDYS